MTDDGVNTVLITGAAGLLGTWLRDELAGHYRLRLTDRFTIADLRPGESFVESDLRDLASMESASRGVDGVVHLGGIPGENEWDQILEVNIAGTYNVYEAARRAGARRVVFASSNHVVGFYSRNQTIGTDATLRPDSRYGVSKACGEALGSLYADKYGLRVTCLRIGWVKDRPEEPRDLAVWLSPRDLGQLVRIGLEHGDIHYEILYGISDNARAWWDNSAATRLGYVPQDRAEDHATAVLSTANDLAPPSIADERQGGSYTTSEGGGHPPQRSRGSRRRWWRRD